MAMNLMQKDGERLTPRQDQANRKAATAPLLKCDRSEGRLGLACSTAERRYILDVPGTGFPFKRPGTDDPLQGAAAQGTISVEQRPKGVQMDRLPDSLAIAMWVVGSCWALAVLTYVIGAPREWILPLVVLGILTGIAEWFMRRGGK
jgi:hypothetical protein